MEQEILKGVASALQIDVTELADVLKKDGEDLKGDAIAKAIAEKVKEEVTTATDARFKAGQSEINRKILKAAKAAGFQNTNNLMGAELVSAAIEFAKTQAEGEGGDAGKDGELTREKLEKNQIVKELIAEKLKAANDLLEQTKSEFDGFKKTASQKERDVVLKEFLGQELDQAKVILDGPTGTNKEQRIATMLKLVPSNVGLKDGKPVFLDEDGNVETDNLGKPKSVAKWAVETATPLFGVRTQDPGKAGAGAPPGGNGSAGGQCGESITFENEAAFNQYMETETDSAKRLAARQAWVSREK
jgi:hypothetical protein